MTVPLSRMSTGKVPCRGMTPACPTSLHPNATLSRNAQGENILLGYYDGWAPYSYGHKIDGKLRDWEGNWISYDLQPNNAIDAYETGYQSNTNVTLEVCRHPPLSFPFPISGKKGPTPGTTSPVSRFIRRHP